MNELIRITEHDGKQAVSARELHAFLESRKQFTDWIKHRINKYGFIENVDYQSFSLNGENGGRTIEYALTLDCAKELAMVEGNAKGKQARQYFIERDKQLKAIEKPLSTLDLLELTIKGMRENNLELQEVKQDIKLLKAQTQTRPEFFTIAGYGSLHGVAVNIKQASSLGRKASDICKSRNIQTDECPDPRFGKVKMYPASVLKEVFELPIN